MSSFCTVNELEKSMSYVEKTAKKLLPILVEVKKRMIPDKKRSKNANVNGKSGIRKAHKFEGNSEESEDDEELIVDLNKLRGNK